jgi:hypothetical protein
MLNAYPAKDSYLVSGSSNDTSGAYSAASIPRASNKCVKSSANASHSAVDSSGVISLTDTVARGDVDVDPHRRISLVIIFRLSTLDDAFTVTTALADVDVVIIIARIVPSPPPSPSRVSEYRRERTNHHFIVNFSRLGSLGDGETGHPSLRDDSDSFVSCRQSVTRPRDGALAVDRERAR